MVLVTDVQLQSNWPAAIHFKEEEFQTKGKGTEILIKSILSCLQTDPQKRPSMELICAQLHDATLFVLLPNTNARNIWLHAIQIDIEQRRARCDAPQNKEANDDDDENKSNEEPEDKVGEEEDIGPFKVEWTSFEKAFYGVYLGQGELPPTYKLPPTPKHPKFRQILALYGLHHLIGTHRLQRLFFC